MNNEDKWQYLREELYKKIYENEYKQSKEQAPLKRSKREATIQVTIIEREKEIKDEKESSIEVSEKRFLFKDGKWQELLKEDNKGDGKLGALDDESKQILEENIAKNNEGDKAIVRINSFFNLIHLINIFILDSNDHHSWARYYSSQE
jgi:hypothetical protein